MIRSLTAALLAFFASFIATTSKAAMTDAEIVEQIQTASAEVLEKKLENDCRLKSESSQLCSVLEKLDQQGRVQRTHSIRPSVVCD